MEENRISLFQGLKQLKLYNGSYGSFIKNYFSNEENVKVLWESMINNGKYHKTLKDFFTFYACDLFSNSTYCGGSGKDTVTTTPIKTTQQSSVFGCLFSGDNRVKKTSDPKQVTIKLENQKWFFWGDGDFRVKEGNVKSPTTSNSFKGKWVCEGNNNFRINTDDGYSYSSKTKEWVKNSNSEASVGSNTISIKLSDIKNGTKSVKIGAKGSIVTKIQDLLIGLGYNDVSNSGKSDGNFGPKTDGMVKKYQKDNGLKDDGIVGSKTIIALLGGKSDATKVEPAVTATQPDNIQGTDGVIIKEKEKLDILQESVKKLLRKSLLDFRKK
jgi:hypothetical protein